MHRFRKLAVTAALAVAAPIVLGGVVRATGSGDACPDWPKCFGRWVPPANYHAILEYSHRLAAALSGLVLLALGLSLLLNRVSRKQLALTVPAGVSFALLLVQSYLGKLVVETSLSPGLVTIHLASALLFQATVTIAAVNSFFIPDSTDESPPTSLMLSADERESFAKQHAVSSPPTALALTASASILAVILVGAYMRAEGASLAFSDWPLMEGRLLPPLVSEPHLIHFAHRVMALLAAIPVVWMAVAATRYKPRNRGILFFAHLSASTYVLQVLAGAATVLSDLSQWSRATHVALASAAFASSVACSAICVNVAKRRAPEKDTTLEVLAA